MNKETIKTFLEKREAKLSELVQTANTTDSADELRSIQKQSEEIKGEINMLKDELSKIEAMEERNATPEGIATVLNVNETRKETDKDVEVRTAFMNYVQKGTNSDLLERAAGPSTTEDSGILIPVTVVNQIIKEMNTYGNIYAKVRKMNIKGGVKFPVGITKPEASWILEGAVSDTLKISTDDFVEFGYKTLECRVAQTLLASIVSLDVFEREFISLVVEAMTYAMEYAIFNGNGTTAPLGILKDTRIKKSNIIEITADELTKYDSVRTKVFGSMSKAYKNKGEFIMAENTYEFLLSAVDTNGQPIARINYGLSSKENDYRYMGKHVETVEDDIITPMSTAKPGDVIGLYMNLNDYAINSNMNISTVQYFDHDSNTKKTKSILIADGKLLDVNGVYIIKLKAAE